MVREDFKRFEKELDSLSKQELKELVMINTYKVSLVRCQAEALIDIMIKKKIATYEEIWKLTNENFKNSTI
jgi:hypothetical protein